MPEKQEKSFEKKTQKHLFNIYKKNQNKFVEKKIPESRLRQQSQNKFLNKKKTEET